MMRRIISLAIVPMMFFPLFLSLSYADDAEVLPKGVTRLRLNSKFYFTVDEKYNDNSDSEDVAADYNANLNSSVFPALSLVEAGFAMPPGSASVGSSVVSMDYEFNIFDFYVEYGLTDRLSIGAKIPYWDVKSNVNATLNTSSATVGKNAFVPGGVAPLAVPGTVPFTTDDVQNLLAQSFGYKRVESWSNNGFSDIEVGARYQYLKTDNWRLAFLGGIRLPTGETDDPDSLTDYPLGYGEWALLFHSNNDYTGIKNTVINVTFKYDLYLPDKEVMRVPNDINQPITPNKEEVDRKLGDVFEFNTTAKYQFLNGLGAFLQYEYIYKFKDDISGNQGLAYEQLEIESDQRSQAYKIGLSYSTIPLYREKKFSIPLDLHLLYRDRFAGKNTLKSQYIEFGIAVYF